MANKDEEALVRYEPGGEADDAQVQDVLETDKTLKEENTVNEDTVSDEKLSARNRCCAATKSIFKKIKANWIKYHLLWLLIIAIIIGVAWPLPGKTLGDAKLGNGLCLVTVNDTDGAGPSQICVWSSISSLCVTFIFLISGMQLKLDKAKKALKKPKPMLVGYLLIFVLTSAFGFAVAGGPKLSPPEFSFGLALFTIMPTTLSSCIVIVGYAKGNTALALLLSVSTNLLGVAVLPLTVTWMVLAFYGGNAPIANVRVDAADLCLSLVFTVLIPLIIGIFIRLVKRFAALIDKFNFSLKLISAALLAAIPWMRISQSSSTFSSVSGGSYVVLIITAFAMHIWLLVLSYLVSSLFLDRNKDLEDVKCLVLVCAQKTLPVSLSVLELLPESIGGNPGLIALSMVIMHLIQTLTDSAIALKWESMTRPPPSSDASKSTQKA